MDSTNFQHQHEHDQHHLQDHFVGCSSINLPSSGYVVSSSLDWNSSILPSRSTNTTFSHKNEQQDQSELTLLSSTTAIPKLEDDMLSSFPSFSGLIHNPGTANNPLENINPWFNGLISSNGMPYSRGLMQFPLEINNNNWSNNNNNGFPNSTSFLNQMGLGVSSPNNSNASTVSSSSPRLGLNLQAMDFLGNNNSSSFGAQTRPNMSYDVVGEEVISPAGKILSNNNKNSSLMNGSITGTKRAAAGNSTTDNQSKASSTNNSVATKKSSLKVSCPPFKVRKEKLGERIAALHQLVSPFGKTDTASVLTEAIGYIQFLQDQIHTLCMPHAKPSRNKPTRSFPMGIGNDQGDGKNEAIRIDLQGRGLCLVPFSWTSYITLTQMDASNHPSYF
ncbi:unnamed protein product [Amaranthus hypochondriacus]